MALALFLGGIIGGIAILISSIAASPSRGTQFVVPGSLLIKIEKPGRYVLWDESATVFDGRRFSTPYEFPRAMQIRITEVPSGRMVGFTLSRGSRELSNSLERRSIGYIDFDKPGKYLIEIKGNFPERVFYLRQSLLSRIFSGFVAFIILSILGWIVAPVIAIVVFIKRSSRAAKPESAVRTENAGPEPENPSLISEQQERTWAMLCHLGALLGYFVPLANIFVPLIIWHLKKRESPLIDENGKESLNFQLSMLIYYLVSVVFTLVIIGIFFLIFLGIFNLICVLVGGIKASSGERFRYPLSIPFIR